ncbi:MAG TPA: hypothetical protein VGA38_04700 [Candidatus Limnocylindria bacterium]
MSRTWIVIGLALWVTVVVVANVLFAAGTASPAMPIDALSDAFV